jgi:hypothetical protein
MIGRNVCPMGRCFDYFLRLDNVCSCLIISIFVYMTPRIVTGNLEIEQIFHIVFQNQRETADAVEPFHVQPTVQCNYVPSNDRFPLIVNEKSAIHAISRAQPLPTMSPQKTLNSEPLREIMPSSTTPEPPRPPRSYTSADSRTVPGKPCTSL